MPDLDYPGLRDALSAPIQPAPPTRWQKWRKGCAIGCGAYLALGLLVTIVQAIIGTPAADDDAAPVAADTVVAAPVVDSLLIAVPAPALPVAAPPPAPAPPVAAEPPAKPARKEVTVYTTRTGDKYHRSGCSSLRKSRNPTTLSEAQSMGYDPCGRCKPPR